MNSQATQIIINMCRAGEEEHFNKKKHISAFAQRLTPCFDVLIDFGISMRTAFSSIRDNASRLLMHNLCFPYAADTNGKSCPLLQSILLFSASRALSPVYCWSRSSGGSKKREKNIYRPFAVSRLNIWHRSVFVLLSVSASCYILQTTRRMTSNGVQMNFYWSNCSEQIFCPDGGFNWKIINRATLTEAPC